MSQSPCRLRRRAHVKRVGRLLAFAGLAAGVGSARAQPAAYVISSGAQGGFYHSAAARITTLLRQERIPASHAPSAGSRANLARLDDPEDPVNLALTQADALRHYLDEHPAFAEEMQVVDDLGRQCVLLITRASGGLGTAADLKKGRVGSLSLPGETSGAAATYAYMSRLDPAFRKTRLVHGDPIEALLALRTPSTGGLAGVMVVRRPDARSPELALVLANPEDFRLAPLRSHHLSGGPQVDGRPVYTFDKLVAEGGRGVRMAYDTLCTRALLVTSSLKLEEEARRELARVLLRHGTLIAPGR